MTQAWRREPSGTPHIPASHLPSDNLGLRPWLPPPHPLSLCLSGVEGHGVEWRVDGGPWGGKGKQVADVNAGYYKVWTVQRWR